MPPHTQILHIMGEVTCRGKVKLVVDGFMRESYDDWLGVGGKRSLPLYKKYKKSHNLNIPKNKLPQEAVNSLSLEVLKLKPQG